MLRRLQINKKFTPVLVGNPIEIFWLGDIHLKKSVDGGSSLAEGATEGYKQYWDGSRRLRSFRDQCNTENPDFVLHLGDILDIPYADTDFDLFTDVWNSITAQKELTIGNHDTPTLAFRNNVLEDLLGYNARTENAMSKFNQSVSITNGEFSARVITLDGNLKPDGNHISTMSGFLQPFQRDWVINELTNCPEEFAFICNHYPVHTHFGTGGEAWESNQKEDYVTMLETVKLARPNMKFLSLFGHEHGYLEPRLHMELGEIAKGYGAVCALDYEIAKYNVISLYPNGEIQIKTNVL